MPQLHYLRKKPQPKLNKRLGGSQKQSGLLEKREISAPAKTWTWDCPAQSTTILTDVSQLKLQHTQTLNFELFVTFYMCTVNLVLFFNLKSIRTVQPTITCPQFKITLHLTFSFSAPKLIISELNFPHLQFSSVFKSTTSSECARFQISQQWWCRWKCAWMLCHVNW